MFLDDFFLYGPVPSNVMSGYYNLNIVALSYFVASLAGFVALDITERFRTSGITNQTKFIWLLFGAIAMGMGIWTMHFIGMLAFIMPMQMDYEPYLTVLSMVIAVVASGFAFYLIKNDTVKQAPLLIGGVFLGLAICGMHYTGMAAMLDVQIRYIPSIFLLSIIVAIAAAEAALWLMIKGSNTNRRYHNLLKLISALVMGLAVCGMHYIGMAAAVFLVDPQAPTMIHRSSFGLDTLSYSLAGTTIAIILIALAASRFWLNALTVKNKKLIETEAILEEKSQELQRINDRLNAILAAAGDGIIVTDVAGNIQVCNRAASELFEYSQDEMIGRKIQSLLGEVTDDQIFHELSTRELAERSDSLFELYGARKNKKWVPLEIAITSSFIENKTVKIIVFRDITKRKLHEQEMKLLNTKLISTARLVGMGEVATCVLHNVGNVLTSIHTSSQVLLERDLHSKIHGLAALAKLLMENKNHLDKFLQTHPVGQELPNYLTELANYFEKEWAFMYAELDSLKTKVIHVKDIITMQQSLSGNPNIVEKVNLKKLLDDALSINIDLIEKHHIMVVKQYSSNPVIEIDKVKIMQALVNIVKNSLEALSASKSGEKKLVIKMSELNPDQVTIEFVDNGIGIHEKNLNKIFNYGFTTKKTGHGFGLHTSALSIQEVGGTLTAASLGPDKGASFVIVLPVEQKHKS